MKGSGTGVKGAGTGVKGGGNLESRVLEPEVMGLGTGSEESEKREVKLEGVRNHESWGCEPGDEYPLSSDILTVDSSMHCLGLSQGCL